MQCHVIGYSKLILRLISIKFMFIAKDFHKPLTLDFAVEYDGNTLYLSISFHHYN